MYFVLCIAEGGVKDFRVIAEEQETNKTSGLQYFSESMYLTPTQTLDTGAIPTQIAGLDIADRGTNLSLCMITPALFYTGNLISV